MMPMDPPGNARIARRADSSDQYRSKAPARGWAALLAIVAVIVAAIPASAAEPGASPATFQGLDAEVRSLKQEIVDLNRDLFLLEEELLFPSNSQIAVFVSMDVGTFFALDSVTLLFDGMNVANYLYTQRELDALLRGGVQRLWVGNIKAGQHEFTAFLTGKGPNGRHYTRGATARLEKGPGAKYLELKISDQAQRLQPEFIITEWE
jgi:hypothetical protein